MTDSIKNTVQKFKEDGTFVEEFGRWGVGNGQFRAAKGIAQDRHGRLYVMDFGNHRGVILKNGADGKLKFVSNFELRDSAEQMRRTSYPLMGKVKRIESNTVVKAGASTADVFEGPSNDGTYKVKVFAAEKLRKNTPTELTVQITPSKGVELAVSGAMPLHGHGLTQLPIVKKTGDGKFLVSNFNLHMKGQWQVFFDIEDGDNFERAQMDVDLQ